MAVLVAVLLVVPAVLDLLPEAEATIGGFNATNGTVDALGGAVRADKPSGNTDDSYAGMGPKEDDTCPQADLSHSAPQNADLTGWWVAADPNNPGILYLAWERKHQTGTLTVDFELNQNNALCSAAHTRINPVRTNNDILVTYDFQGGANVAIQVRLWNAATGKWGAPLTLSSWEASISAAEDFGELAIDLVANGILSTSVCNDFGAGFAKTRTGSNGAFDTSTIKDFIAPHDVNLSNCGTVNVVKATVPTPDAASFSFSATGEFVTSDVTTGRNFALDTDPTTVSPASSEKLVSFPGTVTGSETVPIGWALTSLSCVKTGTTTDVADSDADPNEFAVAVTAGSDITCTFTNTKQAKILVDKVTVPSGDPQQFAFTLTGGPSALNQSFGLADATAPHDSGFVLPGTGYSAAETVPAGWDQTTATCSDGSPVTNIDVAAGEVVTCTFTNTKQASLTITKDAVPDGPRDFAFATTGTGLTSFSLDDDADPALPSTRAFTGLRPGAYSVSESVTAGWALTGIDCGTAAVTIGSDGDFDAGDRSVSVTLDPGEAVSCTFQNTDLLPVIDVDKIASVSLVRPGTIVTYTYVVTNPGVEPLLDVTVTDDKCAPVTFTSGDTDGDRALDRGEEWTYSCASAISVDTLNTVTATGHDEDGNVATATDTATVAVVRAVIQIDKTADPTGGPPGTPITYTYVVTVPVEPLTNVRVTDDQCAPVTYVAGDDGDNVLEPGERWTYTCTRAADASAPTNTAVATGTDRTGATVQASDTVTISVVEPAVIERIPELPRTGADASGLVRLAASLLLLGLSLLLVAGRPRPAAGGRQ